MNLINNVKKLFFIKMHSMRASLKSNKLIYGMYSSISLKVPPNPGLVKGVKRNESTFREQTVTVTTFPNNGIALTTSFLSGSCET